MDSLQGSLVGSLRHSEASPTDELEAGLNSLIERRAAQREDVDEREESWRESVRQYHAEHREARRYMWITHYRRLAGTHRRISEDLERRAQALLNPGEAGS